MKTSRHAYHAKRMIFESNDHARHEHGISVGDMIVEDGSYFLVTNWARDAVTGEVVPAAKHRLDPAKMQALHGGRADYYYPDPISPIGGQSPR